MSKKSFCKIIFVFVLVFLVTGCRHGSTTRGIRRAGFTIGNAEFECKQFLPEQLSIFEELFTDTPPDTNYTKIWYMDDTRIITDTGVIFDYVLGGTFSNNESCKQAEFTKNVVGIMDNKIIKASDGNLYYFSDSGQAAIYSRVTGEDSSLKTYQILFEDPSVIKVVTIDDSAGIYYLLKRDGNIYKYVITKAYSNEPPTLKSSEIVFSKSVYGSIVDFNYSITELGANYIVSKNENMETNGLYPLRFNRSIATNAAMCTKYQDIQCQYTMKFDEPLADPEQTGYYPLSLYQNEMIVYNGKMVITKYGKVFNLAQ